MDRALASSKMAMNTKENYDTAFFTEKALLNGLTGPFTKVNSARTKSPAKATILGRMVAPTKGRYLTDLGTVTELT